jgi:hypothetical protein
VRVPGQVLAVVAIVTLGSGCAAHTSTKDAAANISAASSPASSPAVSSPASPSVPAAASSPISVPTDVPAVPSTAAASTSPTAAPSPIVHKPVAYAVDDNANGTTVHVKVGDTVTVTLHSTYYQMDPPSSAAVGAGATVAAGSVGPGHIPGSGAGTVVTSYIARSPGVAKITAQRTSCGEALACAPDQRTYAVTIAIS